MYGRTTHIESPGSRSAEGKSLHEPAHAVELFMAGDIAHAKQIIRRFCSEHSVCVTVSPTDYIYRGGEEAGFVVTFRNYPRLPSDLYTLRSTARDLGELLRRELGQDSYMTSDGSSHSWSSIREHA
jgi:hypothetical protein